MGIKVNLKNVPVIWLHIFEKDESKKQNDGKMSKAAYKAVVMMPHDHPQQSELEEAVREALAEKKLPEKAIDKWIDRNYGIGNHDDKCAIKDVNERDNPIEQFEDHLYITTKSFKQPVIMTSKGEKQDEPGLTLDGDDIEGKEIYSGCVCNVSVEVYCWANENGKGINVNLLGLRFRDDGEAFGGGSKETASDEDLDDEDDEPRGKAKGKAKSSGSKSRRSRDEEDDDEEERPRSRRRSRDEEDDEEERPRSRRR